MARNGLRAASLVILASSPGAATAAAGGRQSFSAQNAQQAKPAQHSPATKNTQQANPPAAKVPPTVPENAEASAWKVLTNAAASDKTSTRSDAISALASIGPRPEVVQLLVARLADKEADVRVIAATSLGNIKSRESVPALQKALNDDSAQVSFAAAKALWEMHDHSGRDLFIAVLEGDRTASKGLVRGQIDDAKKRLHDPKGLMMMGVTEGAGAFLGPFAMGLTIAEALAKDSSAPARALSANLLGEDSTSESKQELKDALGDKNWVVRAAAAKALGNFPEPELIPTLQPLLDDDKPPVRYMAAASIVRLSIQTPPGQQQPARSLPPRTDPKRAEKWLGWLDNPLACRQTGRVMKELLRRIFLVDLLKGMWVTFRYQNPKNIYTEQYPLERPMVAERYRGAPRLNNNPETGESLCIACNLCALACPENLIVVGWERDEATRRKVLTTFTYDTSRCMFCGLCEDACPTDCLELTQDFEMAQYSREGAIWDRHRLEVGPTPSHYTR